MHHRLLSFCMPCNSKCRPNVVSLCSCRKRYRRIERVVWSPSSWLAFGGRHHIYNIYLSILFGTHVGLDAFQVARKQWFTFRLPCAIFASHADLCAAKSATMHWWHFSTCHDLLFVRFVIFNVSSNICCLQKYSWRAIEFRRWDWNCALRVR